MYNRKFTVRTVILCNLVYVALYVVCATCTLARNSYEYLEVCGGAVQPYLVKPPLGPSAQ